MTRTTIPALRLALPALLALGAASAGELFPPPGDVAPPCRTLAVSDAGGLLVDGTPRRLVGVQHPAYLAADLRPVSGTPEEYRWLYERPLDRDSAARLGFTALSTFQLTWCARDRVPDFNDGTLDDATRDLNDIPMRAELPFYLDFTCFPWRLGRLAAKHADLFPPEALTRGKHHWLSFNILHPEGRKVFVDYWRSGAETMRRNGVKTIAYELFNEPAFDDPSEYNRARFAEFLGQRYGGVAAMNRRYRSGYASFDAAAREGDFRGTPGLFVDWSKFSEAAFAAVCREGLAALRAVDPDSRASVQIMGYNHYRALPRSNVNMLEVGRELNAVTVPTGGGVRRPTLAALPADPLDAPDYDMGDDFASRSFFRHLARGKIAVQSELTPGNSAEAIARSVWLDLARGVDVSLSFLWSKRGWETHGLTPEQRRERFPTALLVRESVPTGALTGFRRAKEEFERLGRFFVPKERNAPVRVAVWLSFATERHAGAVPNPRRDDIARYASALEFLHIPYQVAPEEDLVESAFDGYRFVLLPGVGHLRPGSAAALARFAENGGTVFLAGDQPRFDEYGNPLAKDTPGGPLPLEARKRSAVGRLDAPGLAAAGRLPGGLAVRNRFAVKPDASWRTLASVDGEPALLEKSVGKGKFLFFSGEMNEAHTAGLVDTLMAREGIRPDFLVNDADTGAFLPGLEAHPAFRDGEAALLLFNHDLVPKVLAVRPVRREYAHAVDPLNNRELPRGRHGVELYLPPGGYAVAVFSDERDPGDGLAGGSGEALRKERADARERLAEERRGRQDVARYRFDSNAVKHIDLRPFCNRGFVDKLPADGKDGVFDMGPDISLRNLHWGVAEFYGVPFDIVRYDENEEKTCVNLDSTSTKVRTNPRAVAGIPVGCRAGIVYFLHAAAHARTPGEVAYRAAFRYADGTGAEAVFRTGTDIWDWYLPGARTQAPRIAWRSGTQALYVSAWVNPHPGKEIASLDLVSGGGAPEAAIMAVTVERIMDSQQVATPDLRDSYPFGGALLDRSSPEIRVTTARESTAPNGGVNIRLRGGVGAGLSEAEFRQGELQLEIRGDGDELGSPGDRYTLGFSLLQRGKDGKRIHGTRRIQLENHTADGTPIVHGKWQLVRVPLRELDWDVYPPEINLATFFRLVKHMKYGYSLRNMRLLLPVPAGSPGNS